MKHYLTPKLYTLHGIKSFDLCKRVTSFNRNKGCIEFSIIMNKMLKKNFNYDYYSGFVAEHMSYNDFESILFRYWKCEEV